MTGHVSSTFLGSQDPGTRFYPVNKLSSESMSFITELILVCTFILTDVHMRKKYLPLGL